MDFILVLILIKVAFFLEKIEFLKINSNLYQLKNLSAVVSITSKLFYNGSEYLT